MAITLTPSLRAEYQKLFAGCKIRPERAGSVARFTSRLLAGRERYAALVRKEGWALPWWFVGVIHGLEGYFDWTKHLHNGDPLRARTVRVPAGRPTGKPPFTWEQSAADALRMKRFHQIKDWSISNTLWSLESYNGLGYRQYHPDVLSPYLWSFSTHYNKGKYVADGRFSASAVSSQVGAATALRHLVNVGTVVFP